MRLLALLALAGCGVSTDSSSTFDPTVVPSGVYHLTAKSQTDTCSPPLELDAGDVPVTATPQSIRAFMVVGTQLGTQSYAYTLAADAGYTDHSPGDGQRIDPCDNATANPGNSVTTDFTLAAADAHGFDVDFDRTYVIATACSFAPQASCHVSYALHYELGSATTH